jgi:hypothetical protein
MARICRWLTALVVLIIVAVLISYGFTVWIISQRNSDDSIYDSGWGWLLPGGWFYKLGRGDDGTRERVWPYVFGGWLDAWLYNSGLERRRREVDE